MNIQIGRLKTFGRDILAEVFRSQTFGSYSSNPKRIIENIASLNVDISSEMEAIMALEENYVSGWDPTTEL